MLLRQVTSRKLPTDSRAPPCTARQGRRHAPGKLAPCGPARSHRAPPRAALGASLGRMASRENGRCNCVGREGNESGQEPAHGLANRRKFARRSGGAAQLPILLDRRVRSFFRTGAARPGKDSAPSVACPGDWVQVSGGDYQAQGDLARSAHVVQNGLGEARLNRPGQLPNLFALCITQWVNADLTSARDTAAYMIRLSNDHNNPELVRWAYLFLGSVHYQRNELAEAERYLRTATRPPRSKPWNARFCSQSPAVWSAPLSIWVISSVNC